MLNDCGENIIRVSKKALFYIDQQPCLKLHCVIHIYDYKCRLYTYVTTNTMFKIILWLSISTGQLIYCTREKIYDYVKGVGHLNCTSIISWDRQLAYLQMPVGICNTGFFDEYDISTLYLPYFSVHSYSLLEKYVAVWVFMKLLKKQAEWW